MIRRAGYDVLQDYALDIIHAENYAALTVAICLGVCPETAFRKLACVPQRKGDGVNNVKLIMQLRESGMSWRDIEEYTAFKAPASIVYNYQQQQKKLKLGGM